MRALIGLALSAAVGLLSLGQLVGAPGAPYESSSDSLVDIHPGDLPIVISIPHSGQLSPEEIPDRRFSPTENDPYALELGMQIAQRMEERTGRRPHIIVNPYSRAKVDPHRDLYDGARRQPLAQQVWQDYHAAIDEAGREVLDQCGWGHYFDLHTSSEEGVWIELGYGLTAYDLAQRDEYLSSHPILANADIRTLYQLSGLDMHQLVRGIGSLGGLLQERGYAAVPSPVRKSAAYLYQDGSFSIDLHGSRLGGGLSATQIDIPASLMAPGRQGEVARDLADSILDFMSLAYGFRLDNRDGPLCPPFADLAANVELARVLESARGHALPLACSEDPRLFCPEQSIRRGEVVSLMAIYLPPKTASALDGVPLIPFSLLDDPSGLTSRLWSQGYLDLCSSIPPRYCPDRLWTRADAARVLLKARFGPSYVPRPPDKGLRANWNEWWLEAAQDYGLLPSCGEPSFCPDAVVSRADAALWIARAVDR